MPFICSDCGMEGTGDEIARHLKDDHGINYTIPAPVCDCGCEPCERAKELSTDG